MTKFQINDPDKINFTLTMTMSLKDWKELSEQLSNKWPSAKLSNEISDMTIQALKVFWPTGE